MDENVFNWVKSNKFVLITPMTVNNHFFSVAKLTAPIKPYFSVKVY